MLRSDVSNCCDDAHWQIAGLSVKAVAKGKRVDFCLSHFCTSIPDLLSSHSYFQLLSSLSLSLFLSLKFMLLLPNRFTSIVISPVFLFSISTCSAFGNQFQAQQRRMTALICFCWQSATVTDLWRRNGLWFRGNLRCILLKKRCSKQFKFWAV